MKTINILLIIGAIAFIIFVDNYNPQRGTEYGSQAYFEEENERYKNCLDNLHVENRRMRDSLQKGDISEVFTILEDSYFCNI